MYVFTLIYNTCSYSFPIRINAYFVCVLSILLREIPHKGAYPLLIPISNYCIYACLVNRNKLLGDAVLVILLVIPRYEKILFYIYTITPSIWPL